MSVTSLENGLINKKHFEPNDVKEERIELATIVIPTQPANSEVPSIFQQGRSVRKINCQFSESVCKKVVFAAMVCGSVIAVVVLLSQPKPEYHQKPEPSLEEINLNLVNGTSTYMEQTFRNLLAKHNASLVIRPVIDSFSQTFANLLNTVLHSYYWHDGKADDVVSCSRFFEYFDLTLTPTVPLIGQSLSVVTNSANITLASGERSQVMSSMVEHMCDIAVENGHGCVGNICNFIPKG